MLFTKPLQLSLPLSYLDPFNFIFQSRHSSFYRIGNRFLCLYLLFLNVNLRDYVLDQSRMIVHYFDYVTLSFF